jgi:hypothetical protein
MAQVGAVIVGGAFIYLCAQPLLELAADKVDDWKRARAKRRQETRPD